MRSLARATACLIVLVGTTGVGVVARDELRIPSDLVAFHTEIDPTTLAARDFLHRYVDPDGRVVRRDQGGDTVSEGQAYALLLAVVADDRGAFERVWSWTRAHLQRGDGLLAWRWDDGRVVDQQPAADADLDAAWALALADQRWPGAGYGRPAHALARAVVAFETAPMPDGRPVVVPGPWARERSERGDGLVLNPSYWSPVAEAVLVRAGHLSTEESRARRETAQSVLEVVVDQEGLAPDWMTVESDGRVRSVAGPEDPGPGRFGWDAVRVPLRLAASCGDRDRALVARLAPALRDGAGSDAMGDHPARLVAVASASAAAGDDGEAAELLDRASREQARAPTYYGGALTALARALLTTDRLGGCPPP